MVRSREERTEEVKMEQHFMALICTIFRTSTALEDLTKGNFGKGWNRPQAHSNCPKFAQNFARNSSVGLFEKN
jgi:hypothetical protein